MPQQDTKYAPQTVIYRSRGLIARPVTDQPPPESYLDLLNALEREENSMSSRYGTVVINRDPVGYGIQNYAFAAAGRALARLAYLGSSYRYVGLADGTLQRRDGLTQGQFTKIASGLSGLPWQSVIASSFATAQPYLFIYDAAKSIKDSGTGTPTLTGIDPSPVTLGTQPYAPQLSLIDNFASGNSYTLTGDAGFSGSWAWSLLTSLAFTSGQQVTDFPQLFGASAASLAPAANGMLALPAGSSAATPHAIASIVSSGLASGIYSTLTVTLAAPHGFATGTALSGSIYGASNQQANGFYTATATGPSTVTVPFSSSASIGATGGILYLATADSLPTTVALGNIYSTPYTPQASAFGFYQPVPAAATTLPVGFWSGTLGQNSTATISKTVALDLSQNNQVTDDDLIVLVLAVSDPASIANIRLQFDVADSNYTTSYYYKDIAPAYYQTGVQNLEQAYTTTEQQQLAQTLGVVGPLPPNSLTAQLQPGNLSTGSRAWTAILLRRGDFVAVGTAGASGTDWSAVTGWQLVLDTNTVGSSTISVNGLYLQWGAGPSSFGGVGFDYRATYININTLTESNGTPVQQFSEQYGWLASLAAPVLLRQAAALTGQFSSDPQVTHLRLYRRGGTRASNWFQIAQVPNVTAGGTFSFKDVVPDAVLAQAQPLVLDNDPPVTSSLQQPIATWLISSPATPGASVFSLFTPQTVTVQQANATFVPGQIVDVGYSYNLEQVRVETGGTGQFTARFQLQHDLGEPVAVYSVPRQPCNLAAQAYNQTWLAGDPNNPNFLYFSKPGRPEAFGPQNYLAVGSPQYPIVIVVNWRGTLFVCTTQKWWIINGGARPTAQPTGSIHGAVGSQAWCEIEGGIAFWAQDGIRVFAGSDGDYLTLPVEFLFRAQQTDTPVPVADLTRVNEAVLAYYNNTLYAAYWAVDGQRLRLAFDFNYKRFRYDDVGATAMLWEPDTNMLLAAKQQGAAAGANAGQYVLVQDQVLTQDYDDGGYVNGLLLKSPVAWVIQHPYYDIGQPHYPKQWNMLETDCNTQNQTLTTELLFKTEPAASLTLASINTGLLRQKAQLVVSDPASIDGGASGYQAFSASIRHTMQVLVAPTLYQENIYAAVLADLTTSFDTYWIKLNYEESKIIKQGYFDYTSTVALDVRLFADGSLEPYYQFTLPASPSQSNRLVVRRLFAAWKPRLWRMTVVASDGLTNFQMWSAPQVDWKPIDEGAKGYARAELTT